MNGEHPKSEAVTSNTKNRPESPQRFFLNAPKQKDGECYVLNFDYMELDAYCVSLLQERDRLREFVSGLADQHCAHGGDRNAPAWPCLPCAARAALSGEPSAHETAGEHVYDADILQFLGWISGDFPEMHAVEVPRLKDSWERFKRIRAALLRTPENG